MLPSKPLDALRPLELAPIQAYFSNKLQIGAILEWVLAQIGPADVTISTFSTSEEFIRRVARLKAKGLIGRCSLFCDIRAARKTLAIYNFIKATFDDVYLCENHSKVLHFRGSAKKVVIVTSQNQTRGDRYECGVISAMEEMADSLEAALTSLKTKSRPLNELLS